MRLPSRVSLVLAALTLLFLLALARRARAQTEEAWFDADESRLEERFADGDLDAEDLASIPSPTGGARSRRPGGSDLLARSWVSLVGLSRDLPSGTHEWGGFVVVGLALDKIVQRGMPVGASFAEDASPRVPRPAPELSRLAPPELAIDAALARGAVRTAWRVSGIEVNDARIDEMISRSRLSVLLPETRVRAMERVQDGQHTSSYVNQAGTVVDTTGSNATIEARLTWRFDRLIFSGDEPTLERLRLEREEARNRIAGRVLELLFAWQRALLDVGESDVGSRAEQGAMLRQYEAEISLDVITAGWFGTQPPVRTRRSIPPRAK